MFSRAKQHLHDNQPRFQPDPAEHRQILNQFLQAASTGNLQALTELLVEDVVLVPDGGGERGAAIRILEGQQAVIAFIMGSQKLIPENGSIALEIINGEEALVIRHSDGSAFNVISFVVNEGKIQCLYAIAGAHKLRGV